MSSLTSPTSSRGGSPGPPQSRARTNRAALRDYYGLKSTIANDSTPEPSPQLRSEDFGDHVLSDFDVSTFDADDYVKKTLATKHLNEILQIESRLIGEIRSLDGEKKALVYDNYSKLITATDTIRRMRDNMAPLMPEDSSLNDDIAHIAKSAENLAAKPQTQGPSAIGKDQAGQEEAQSMRARIETVRWVLNAPERLGALLTAGNTREAEEDWREIESLLDRWEGVQDVDQIRHACEKLMRRHNT